MSSDQLHGVLYRFVSNVVIDEATTCWLWKGSVNADGYGRCSSNRLNEAGAHRIAYTLDKGPIPEGMQVCHTCDNPTCVNPAHLWLGTAHDNIKDRQDKGRSRGAHPGEKHHNNRLTEDQVRAIRLKVAQGQTQRSVGEEFGITQSTVCNIVHRRQWKHVL